ncbi:hypothetical protein [Thiothrix nivea]|uniref:Uncharacterized protein n=1 Tax=Thiothrix nivea (strain ATCC 35100 / DSM 5205 / JP2) TaxID=870187 RepID=A0A656HCY3_THINJ|nr:hypothetical protein [Thiothrix nivea]EIJ33320.1 hypothetical protein Thini_0683 [Thiothrix nivea DSM 5205]
MSAWLQNEDGSLTLVHKTLHPGEQPTPEPDPAQAEPAPAKAKKAAAQPATPPPDNEVTDNAR